MSRLVSLTSIWTPVNVKALVSVGSRGVQQGARPDGILQPTGNSSTSKINANRRAVTWR
jgi:hypothetical protein